MIAVNRRRYMGASGGGVQWPLKYWLSGEDAPVNNKWIDRLNPDIQWSVGSRVEYDSTNKRYLIKGRQSDGYLTSGNAYQKYDFGYHFRMIINGTINEAYSTSYIIDFGSVTSASKAMGWGFSGSRWTTNYKLSGNNSSSLYDVTMDTISESQPFDFEVEYGCEAVTSSTSRMYILYKGVYYYGPIFNNILINNFDNRQFRIGQGFAGNQYGTVLYLNDWKIYVEPYE